MPEPQKQCLVFQTLALIDQKENESLPLKKGHAGAVLFSGWYHQVLLTGNPLTGIENHAHRGVGHLAAAEACLNSWKTPYHWPRPIRWSQKTIMSVKVKSLKEHTFLDISWFFGTLRQLKANTGDLSSSVRALSVGTKRMLPSLVKDFRCYSVPLMK